MVYGWLEVQTISGWDGLHFELETVIFAKGIAKYVLYLRL